MYEQELELMDALEEEADTEMETLFEEGLDDPEWESNELGDDFELEALEVESGDDELDYFGELDELEGDPFLGKLFRGVKRGFKKVGRFIGKGVKILKKGLGPIFKVLAPIAAKIVGGVVGGPAGAAIGGAIANAVMREAENETVGEAEESIYESETEVEEAAGDDEELALMEEYAGEAAEAEESGEATRAMIGMIAQAARGFRRNPRLRVALPRVSQAAMALARTFRANVRTRWAIKVIPLIVKRTLAELSRRRAITKRVIVEVMARHTAWVLANRRRATAALKRHRVLRSGVRRRLLIARKRRPRHPARRRILALRGSRRARPGF